MLDGLDADTRARFMGENILEVFERMGDPLPVARASPGMSGAEHQTR